MKFFIAIIVVAVFVLIVAALIPPSPL